MFYATAGRGTEPFLTSEISEKFKTKVITRDGKVFFTIPDDNYDHKVSAQLLSLKTAERVFVALTDFDNNRQIQGGKKAFLDDLMPRLSQRDIYMRADAILRHSHVGQSSDSILLGQQNSSCTKTNSGQADEEPAEKCARLEVSQTNRVPHQSLTFRMSVKCSGKLKKRLDIQRLSRDSSKRVAQASGWRVQLRHPDVEVCVHINDEHVTVGVPLTRQPLSRRYYIQDFGLRAPVAWIMCQLAEIQAGDVVLDPMCGKATILLEGASTWKEVVFVGGDTSAEQLCVASRNTCDALCTTSIDLLRANGLSMPVRSCSIDVVVCDAPFNQNHATSVQPLNFYRKYFQEIQRVLRKDGRCVLLTSEEIADAILKQPQQQADRSALNAADTSATSKDHSLNSCRSEDDTTESGAEEASSPEATQETSVGEASSTKASQQADTVSDSEPRYELQNQGQGKLTDIYGGCNESTGCDNLFVCGSLEFVSQHRVKLGETLACLIKFNKR